jgi:hypothetical protein
MGMPTSSGQLENPPEGFPPNTSVATSTGPRPPAVNVHTLPAETSSLDVAEGTLKPTEGSLQ